MERINAAASATAFLEKNGLARTGSIPAEWTYRESLSREGSSAGK